jgi:hypothetical protein
LCKQTQFAAEGPRVEPAGCDRRSSGDMSTKKAAEGCPRPHRKSLVRRLAVVSAQQEPPIKPPALSAGRPANSRVKMQVVAAGRRIASGHLNPPKYPSYPSRHTLSRNIQPEGDEVMASAQVPVCSVPVRACKETPYGVTTSVHASSIEPPPAVLVVTCLRTGATGGSRRSSKASRTNHLGALRRWAFRGEGRSSTIRGERERRVIIKIGGM